MTIAPAEEVGSRSGTRALVAGLATAQSISSTLPSLFQEDDFCVRLTTAFDDALAPIVSTLDCFSAYLDPHLAPQDFADWLAGWVGLETDETWPPDRRRLLVAEAIELYRRRGTRAGLVRHVELYTGVEPGIEENGACTWSRVADGPLPGSPVPRLTVRVQLDALEDAIDVGVVERIVRSCRPAHVPHQIVHGPAPTPRAHDGGSSAGLGAEIAPPRLVGLDPEADERVPGEMSDGEGAGTEPDEESGLVDGKIGDLTADPSDGHVGDDGEEQGMASTSTDGLDESVPPDDDQGSDEAGAPP